jgi:hypothetical protein
MAHKGGCSISIDNKVIFRESRPGAGQLSGLRIIVNPALFLTTFRMTVPGGDLGMPLFSVPGDTDGQFRVFDGRSRIGTKMVFSGRRTIFLARGFELLYCSPQKKKLPFGEVVLQNCNNLQLRACRGTPVCLTPPPKGR